MSDSFLAMMTDAQRGPAIFRLAETMAGSQLIPPHLRGKVDDVFVALAMADQMGENPVVVMQNIYVVSGRAGWSAAYMIARANTSGVFRGRINWRVTGKGDALSVTAFATLADSGEVVEMTTDMAMAVAETWTKNAKYKSMPEVMLRYRSATLLIRMFAADVMLGMRTDVELETMDAPGTVSVAQGAAPQSAAVKRIAEASTAPLVIPATAERVVEPAPVVTPAAQTEAPRLTANQSKAITAGATLGLAREALEAKIGRPANEWSREDLLSLSSHLATLREALAPAAAGDEEGA